MTSDRSGGRWSLVLATVAVVIGVAGVVLIDLRDDVPIGDHPNTGAGIAGVVCMSVAVLLLGAAFVWRPVQRTRVKLRRESALQRAYDDAHGAPRS